MKTRPITARLLKPSVISGILLVFIVLIGFYMLPGLLKSKIPDIIRQQTGREAAIANIRFDFFPLRVHLNGFAIKEHDGRPFAAFDTFFVQVNALESIKQSALVIDKILLSKPFVRIAQQKNGVFNFQDLSKNKGESSSSSKAFPLSITQIALTEGKLTWESALDNPIKEDAYPVNISIQDFKTVAEKPFHLDFSLTLSSGAHLDWQGNTGINPLFSEGHVKFDKFQLQKLLALALPDSSNINLQASGLFDSDYKLDYAADKLNLVVNKAKLELHDLQYAAAGQEKPLLKMSALTHESDVRASYSGKTWQVEANKAKVESHDVQISGLGLDKVVSKIPFLSVETAYKSSNAGNSVGFILSDGKLDSRDLQFSEQDKDKNLLKIPAIALRGITLNLKNRELALDSVAASDADLQAWLTPEGEINYQALLPVANPVATLPTPEPAKQEPWTIKVNSIALSNASAAFEDQTLEKPVAVKFKPIDFKLTNFSNVPGAILPFQFNTGVNKTGTIELKGSTIIEPMSAKIGINVNNIDLEKFQAYYDKFIRLNIDDGMLHIDGDLSVARQAENKLDVKFNGNTQIESLLTRDQIVGKDLVKWENLALKDIAVDLLANRYTAATLVIKKPYVRAIIRKDKTINFSDVIIPNKNKPNAPIKTTAQNQTKPNKPYFGLGKVQVIDGASDFTDLSLILPFTAQIESLDGGASGISSDQKSTVTLDLKGNAYELSPVNIKGKISPYLGDYNLALNFNGLPMPLVSPYMVQFAGYKVEKGKIWLDLKYDINNGKLEAQNSMLIDQFELGDKVDNPNAVSLPVGLAVALLKDLDGKIKINVPLSGNTNDPQFSMGSIITDALLNTLGKIVTSPFNAIASLIGSKEKLDTVTFPPGYSELQKPQQAKLDVLSKALKERPVLNLDIKGAAYVEQDWPVIREDALYEQLKKRRAVEINKDSDKKIRSEYVELTSDDYKRLLTDMFMEKYPQLVKKSFLGTPQLTNPEAGDFYEVAKQNLFKIIKPEQDRLKILASARAQIIANYIVQKGGIENKRVFILDTAIDPKRDNKQVAVSLSLNGN